MLFSWLRPKDFVLSTYRIASELGMPKYSATLNAGSKLMALSFSLTHNDRFSPQLQTEMQYTKIKRSLDFFVE